MSKNIKPEELGKALTKELTMYHTRVIDRVNECGKAAVDKLVKLTKATAPVGARGSFKRHITGSEKPAKRGAKTYVWHVKAPDYRLTHLLVHPHATKDGGSTKGDPFLANAVAEVLPEYVKEIEEAVKP